MLLSYTISDLFPDCRVGAEDVISGLSNGHDATGQRRTKNHLPYDHEDILEPEDAVSTERLAGAGRELPEQSLSLQIYEASLLANAGNVLQSGGSIPNVEVKDIFVSGNGTTVLFAECNVTSGGPVSCNVKRAVLAPGGEGYTINHIAGPWLYTSSSTAEGILLIDDTTLLVADSGNNVVKKVDIRTRDETNFTTGESLPKPLRLAKHPSEQVVFVSSVDRIYKVPLEYKTESIPQVLAGDSGQGYSDSTTGATVRFSMPRIGGRSISGNGSALYVADTSNHLIRQVNTSTGATRTLAGNRNGVYPWISRDGPPNMAKFSRPCGIAVTSDGCNLFVAEYDGGAIRWVTMKEPDGDVMEVKTVAVMRSDSNSSLSGSFTSLTLSDDDGYLFVGTNNFRLFKLEVKASVLHRCGAGSADNSSRSNHGGERAFWNKHKKWLIALIVIFGSVGCCCCCAAMGKMCDD
ncbi:hypothetical protein CBR_g6282 [Chara braunii]|uniref:SMP-30/Gluconolactonase/LRE-like region domain-containing protein n=1 Tax=Chara braunii TaxID=69332 RepID=A0A388KJC0_CHABU|nr:hypothetical protein CBR_g6282 [Chara braunii]|eukprot:GBG70151.1 hypothetical protein CBR_g6282 [Chara braunii]